MLMQKANVLALVEQQGNTGDRYGRQHKQRHTQTEDGLMSKTQHFVSLLWLPWPQFS